VRELWSIFWGKKWIIFSITSLFTVLGVVYAISLPNKYMATGVFASYDSKEDAIGKLGGLAAVAGIGVSEKGGMVEQAITLATSWEFVETFFNKYELAHLIYAVEGWDAENDQLMFDSSIYNPERKEWVADSRPSSYEIYKKFRDMLKIRKSEETGLILVSLEFYAPRLAQEWLVNFVADLNSHFKERDIKDAESKIYYLNAHIEKTGVSEMRRVLFETLSSSIEQKMLAEIRDDYVLREVVPIRAPSEKSSPSRSLIVIMATLIGGIVSMLTTVVVWAFCEKNKSI
jgi:LPS O-antigen subunit length determinant protein (WzzB/FepE family)